MGVYCVHVRLSFDLGPENSGSGDPTGGSPIESLSTQQGKFLEGGLITYLTTANFRVNDELPGKVREREREKN